MIVGGPAILGSVPLPSPIPDTKPGALLGHASIRDENAAWNNSIASFPPFPEHTQLQTTVGIWSGISFRDFNPRAFSANEGLT